MNLIPIQVIGNDQKLVPAQMVECDQCFQSTFRILVINGHNHLECTTCGTSYCQGNIRGCCNHSSVAVITCRKCGTPLENGLCKDETCPYSEYEQIIDLSQCGR